MRIETFRLSVFAGSLTRLTQGALPVLLPMMLQLGFGMSAAASGSNTIAGAIGSFGMKWLAPRALKQFGFRNALVVNGLIASAGYAVCGFFRPGWPVAAIFAVLAACGFFMSFQFTAYNTIAYDEIPPERMSAATSFYATFQQLMLSLGICVGAVSLHIGMLATRTVRRRGSATSPSPSGWSPRSRPWRRSGTPNWRLTPGTGWRDGRGSSACSSVIHRLGQRQPSARTSLGFRASVLMVFGDSSLTMCTGSSPPTGLVATLPISSALSMAHHSALAWSSCPTAKKWRRATGSPDHPTVRPSRGGRWLPPHRAGSAGWSSCPWRARCRPGR